jgi:segregation and condensation protein A
VTLSALEINVAEFSGPLDLLLHLIQRRRLDITALSLATVADQYLEQVLAMEGELDALSEFLVLASQLLVIKSRALLPVAEPQDVAENPAEELRRRLAEYELLRDAARWLADREADGARSFARGGELIASSTEIRLAPVAPQRLAELAAPSRHQRSQAAVSEPIETTQRPSLRARVAALLAALSGDRWQSISRLFGNDRISAVATFLALLTLVRRAMVEVRQPAAYGPLEMRRGPVAPSPHTKDPEW